MLRAGLGSTSLTTDENGAVFARQRYLPYGEVRGRSGDLPTDFTYTGQRGEAAFGLIDYHARWYSPRLGRFVSPDTMVPDPRNFLEFSRYGYCLGNPINFVDPTGHQVRFSHADSVIESLALGGGGSGSSAYARIPLDPTGGGPGYVPTLRDEMAMGHNPELSWYNLAEWGGNLWGHASDAANWLYGNASVALDSLLLSAKDALSELVNIQDHTVAIAVDGTRTHSGWRDRTTEGYVNGRNATSQVLKLSKEMGYQLGTHIYDQGVSGRYYASHAEKQMSVVAPNQPLAISHPNGMCADCINYFKQYSIYSKMPQVIADPNGVNIFINGTYTFLNDSQLPTLLQ